MSAESVLPRYPVYVPSKGRADQCLTARELVRDGVPFRLVVEPREVETYAATFGRDRILILPRNDNGSVIPARNWIKAHSVSEGHTRHWQIDDNIRKFRRRWHGKRIPVKAGIALRCVEDFTDRYENVAVSGLNYSMFLPDHQPFPPFYLNHRVYSCTLVLNDTPYLWRGRYNEDTDLCLQVLSGGWCTVLVNAFMCEKVATMVMKGGNTTTLYGGDGRLRMARSLERLWPGVVTTRRRFQRPQHCVAHEWGRFDTQLIPKPKQPPLLCDYGMTLVQIKPVKSQSLKALIENPNFIPPPPGHGQ